MLATKPHPPKVTEAPEPGRELDDAKPIERGDVVVEPPTQAFIELLGPVDVGYGDDLDFEVKVELPHAPVAAFFVYFRTTHACLLRCPREDLSWSRYR